MYKENPEMKNIFKLITAVMLFACTVCVTEGKAQIGGAIAFPHVAGDTLSNTDSVFKVVSNSGLASTINIQVNLNKLSGTVAGKVYLYKSNDTRNWVLADSASYTAIPAGASGTAFGATGSYTHTAQITVTPAQATRYGILATSSGTVSADTQFLYAIKQYGKN